MALDCNILLRLARGDRELGHKLRGLTATIRIDLGDEAIDLRVEEGRVAALTPATGEAEIRIAAPPSFWRQALVARPPVGFESLTPASLHGLQVEGDFRSLLAPYQGALQRLFLLMRRAATGGEAPQGVDPEPYRATDAPTGRYAFVRRGDEEARIYYEEAGAGPVTLVLQHTAGADGRQYRHMLANPELQRRFRMIAWDLPYHGKSLPPIGSRWWEQDYRPTKADLLDWSAAIVEQLAVDRPIYLGCSLGGQLALDLAAHHRDRFRAFVSVNGWYEIRSRGGYNNDIHRHPLTSTDYFASRILSATAPDAPEAAAQEVYWVYRSNFPGVYAGDNDYFMELHDLREDGHLIRPDLTPVYVLCGEYDASMLYPGHGGQAVAEHVPGVVFRELAGLGHFAPSDDPVRFCEAVIPILDEIVQKAK